MQKRRLLGQILMENGLIDSATLEKALSKQEQTGKRLGQILVEMGVITGSQIADALAKQGHKRVNLLEEEPDWELVKQVEEEFLRRNLIVPFKKNENILLVVAADPTNYQALDALIPRFNVARVEPCVGAVEEIVKTLDKLFNVSLSGEIDDSLTETEDNEEVLVDDSPLVKFLNELLARAIRENASDIHIEPQIGPTRVRFRIDGHLVEVATIPKGWHGQAISRIKIMAGCDIAKKLEPQDGEIRFKFDNSFINMRVNILPTINGEKAVIRILGQGATLINLDSLGFSEYNYRLMLRALNKKQGMILITGPTGSGKTTTLYAALNRLNKPNVNITTIEDPVEIRLPGINQTQVGVRVSFASALRAILRQDPDIIMVGEIRDHETASIAVKAALTGHLLFSTLHTLDTIGVITRLLDMGIEPYLVADALELIAAQRLVRAICPKCKVEDEEGLKQAKELFPETFKNVDVLYKGKGCVFCNHQGFKGRLAVHEILVPEQNMRSLIANNKIDELREKNNAIPILEDGLAKVIAGYTSFGELMTQLGYAVEE